MKECKDCIHKVVCVFKTEAIKAQNYIEEYKSEDINTCVSPIRLTVKCSQFIRQEPLLNR